MNLVFPVASEYTADDIKKVQRELLRMAKIVTKILEENDIPYFIAFGTLIGAIKFKGFLPWDDDIDLFLFDDSYAKAIALLEEKLPEHLIVHSEKNDPNYFLAWNNVVNINTTVEYAEIYHPDNRLLGYKCLGVGLYRLKKMKRSEIPRYKKDEAIKFFKRKYNKKIIDKATYKSEVAKINKNNVLFGVKSDADDDIFYFVVKVKKPISIKDVYPLKKIDFEDTQFFAPNDPLAVLECSFENLGELPPYEERRPHLKNVKFIKE